MSEENKFSLLKRFTSFEKIVLVIVMLSGFFLTGIAYRFVSTSNEQRVLAAFEQEATETANSLSNTLNRHTNLLVGLQGLFHSSQNTTRLDFDRYIRSIDIDRNHPGAAAISWNASVPFDEVSEFVRSVQTDTSLVPEGYPDFGVKPALEQGAVGIVVTYMRPMEGNENAFGFNIASNPARRAASYKARDTGKAVITEPIVLAQDAGSSIKAFLMLLPTYSTLDLTDEQSRRRAYNGQVVVVTRAAELIRRSSSPDVTFFQVQDNTDKNETTEEDRFIYESGVAVTDHDSLRTEREIEVGSRLWQLSFQQSLANKSGADSVVEKVVLGLGGLTSILAALLFGQLATSRRKAELHAEELTVDLQAANEELTRSNADLSQFAHVASHDLQTPVRNVISSVTLLEAHLGDSSDPAVKELFGLLTNSSIRMRALVTDLLEYARLGRDAINFSPVNLNDVLKEVRSATLEHCEQAGAQLTTNPLPAINGDARQLNRVFENLVTNSIKYAHPDRAARITISKIEGENEGNSNTVHISVTDNGQGIEEKFRDTVFLPFKRLHRHDEIAGTGLGLGICKQIIERHGGTITIEQSSTEGTTFLIVLPTDNQKTKSP